MILQYLLEFISFVLDLSNKRLCYNKYVCCSFCKVMLNADFPNSVLEGNQSTGGPWSLWMTWRYITASLLWHIMHGTEY